MRKLVEPSGAAPKQVSAGELEISPRTEFALPGYRCPPVTVRPACANKLAHCGSDAPANVLRRAMLPIIVEMRTFFEDGTAGWCGPLALRRQLPS